MRPALRRCSKRHRWVFATNSARLSFLLLYQAGGADTRNNLCRKGFLQFRTVVPKLDSKRTCDTNQVPCRSATGDAQQGKRASQPTVIGNNMPQDSFGQYLGHKQLFVNARSLPLSLSLSIPLNHSTSPFDFIQRHDRARTISCKRVSWCKLAVHDICFFALPLQECYVW